MVHLIYKGGPQVASAPTLREANHSISRQVLVEQHARQTEHDAPTFIAADRARRTVDRAQLLDCFE
jgi:hypothetical protein